MVKNECLIDCLFLFPVIFENTRIWGCAKKEKPSFLNDNDLISQANFFKNWMGNAHQIVEYVVEIFEDKIVIFGLAFLEDFFN